MNYSVFSSLMPELLQRLSLKPREAEQPRHSICGARALTDLWTESTRCLVGLPGVKAGTARQHSWAQEALKLGWVGSPRTSLEREATHRLLECKKRVIRPSGMMVLREEDWDELAGISLVYLHPGMAFFQKQTNKYFHFFFLIWKQAIKSQSLIRWKYRPGKFSDPPKARQEGRSKAGIPRLVLFWLGAQGACLYLLPPC